MLNIRSSRKQQSHQLLMPARTGQRESGVVVRIRLGIKVDDRDPGSGLRWIGGAILGAGQVVTSLATPVAQHSTSLSCRHLLLLLL